MKALNTISSIIVLLITLPIWYFLLYTLLTSAHVDRLCWFLFWIYVPFGFVASVLGKIVESGKK